MKLTRLTEVMITAVLGIILISYLFIPVVASSVVTVTDNQNPSWVRMAYTEEDFSFSAVVSDGNMTIGTQTGEATEMMLFACDSGMLMYDDGFKLIYQSAGNTVVRESDATAIAVSCNNKTVTVLMGGSTYSMPMTWAYYPNAEGIFSYFPTDSYNFREGDPVAVFGDFAGVLAYNDMASLDVGMNLEMNTHGKVHDDMHWVKTGADSGQSATVNSEEVPDFKDYVLIGDLYYSFDDIHHTATVDGYSSSIVWSTFTSIPDTVTYEGQTYPITRISEDAFMSCNNLALTSLPSGLTSIGNEAFRNSNLALTSLPSGLTSIDYFAFFMCRNLALTSLPSGLTSIGYEAFSLCPNISISVLPSSLTYIGYSAFRSCTGMTSLVVLSSPTIDGGEDVGNVFDGTNIKQVLNLGTTEITKTSYGLHADEVRTDIQADGCIAIIHDEQEKSDTVSTLMKILPIIILMVLLVLIAGPMFGMTFGRGDSDSPDSDDYDYY